MVLSDIDVRHDDEIEQKIGGLSGRFDDSNVVVGKIIDVRDLNRGRTENAVGWRVGAEHHRQVAHRTSFVTHANRRRWHALEVGSGSGAEVFARVGLNDACRIDAITVDPLDRSWKFQSCPD
jgi:hypothetical protein